MKKTLTAALWTILLLAAHGAFSQNVKDAIEGTWKGTSLCQVANSPCHDETAVYHFTKLARPNTYSNQMNKLVNGVEEEMGVTEFTYDPSTKKLVGITLDRQKREGRWEFLVEGNHITGTLTIGDNILYRKIDVTKQ